MVRSRRCVIFPRDPSLSIVTAIIFHYRVRNGSMWIHYAIKHRNQNKIKSFKYFHNHITVFYSSCQKKSLGGKRTGFFVLKKVPNQYDFKNALLTRYKNMKLLTKNVGREVVMAKLACPYL